jgi:hypothetical protein
MHEESGGSGVDQVVWRACELGGGRGGVKNLGFPESQGEGRL